jgi:hypothetical protein
VSGSCVLKQWAGLLKEREIITNDRLFLLPFNDIHSHGHIPLFSAASLSLQPFTRLREYHNLQQTTTRKRHSIAETRQQRAPVRPRLTTLRLPNMRPAQLLSSIALFSALSSASAPWSDFSNLKAIRDINDVVFARQDNSGAFQELLEA